jgi:N-formylmaleamate deformylase
MLPNWSQNDVQVNGKRSHYYRSAGEGKSPLVLAHGFSDNGLCWLPMAHDLEGKYDIIMPDASGHGLSARVTRGEKTDMAADLAEVIRSLGLKQPIIGGHSMGAVVTAQVGARFPEMARALILEDPAWQYPEPDASKPGLISEENPFKAWIDAARNKTLDDLAAECHLDHPTWSDIVVRMWAMGKQQLDPNFFSTSDAAWLGWQGVVRGIKCPVLLITADPDKGGIITEEIARMVTEMNSGFCIVHIPGAGHHVRFEAEGAYMDAVHAFLKSL